MTVISVKGEGMVNVLAIFGGVVLAVIILWVAKASIERTRMCNVMESTIRNMWMQTGAVTPEQQDRIALELMSGPFFSVQNLKQYRTALAVLNIMSGDIVKDKELANDIFQETFVKVFLKLDSYNPEHTFGKWVYTIARNTFIDFTRRRRDDTISIDRATETMSSLPAPDSPTPEEHMITHQNAAQFEQFLNKMTPRYRELIQLRFFREFSYKEIADKLQLPIGTVKTQIHRAREQLCRYITEHNDDQP